jgi:hypothetical protein
MRESMGFNKESMEFNKEKHGIQRGHKIKHVIQ